MIGTGQDRAPARLADCRFDFRRIGRYHHRADGGGFRPPQHMRDHRLAGNVGERFARQPGRGHAGRDEDEHIRHFA